MTINEFLRIIGSLRFAACILVLLCIAMACATVYEAQHGTPAALEVFYKADWFQILLGLLGLNVLASMLARYPWSRRHAGFLITHASLLGILGGAWVTEQWGINGQLAIVEGETARSFRTDQPVLTLRPAGQEPVQSAYLSGGVGGLKPRTDLSAPALQAGEARAVVTSYLPDSVWAEQIVNDNSQPNLALEVSLAAEGEKSSKSWVFADAHQTGNLPVSVRTTTQPAEVDQFLAVPTSQPAASKSVKLEIAGKTFELPLEQCLAGPVAVGDTGYTVKVLRYLPHALVGENKQLYNASEQPVNPAIEAEITGPNGTDMRRAYARFPDYGSMHGAQASAADVKLTFIAPADDQAKTPIEILAGPDGRLAAKFSGTQGQPVLRELKVGQAVETPWPGLTFTVVQRFENARRDSVIQPVEPARENRVPAIEVRLQSGPRVQRVWLRKHEPQTVNLQGTRYELAFDDKNLPLGFEVKLNKFHVGTYPGSGQPRSFESHVTLVNESGTEDNRIISMNNPAKFGSYSLFQSSYQQRGSGPATSVLSVSWDPGMQIVFGSYVMLIAGMLYVLATRMRARRGSKPSGEKQSQAGPMPSKAKPSLTSAKAGKAAVAIAVLLSLRAAPAVAQSKLPANVDMNAIRGLPVQHDGRWMPLDTVARDVVNAVTGEKFYRGQDPVKWLLAWTFHPAGWFHEPLVPISSAELRGELKLAPDREAFSYAELVQHQPLREQIDHLSHRSGRGKMNPLESKVSDINRRLIELQEIFQNEVIKPIPDEKSAMAAWKPIKLDPSQASSYTPVQSAWANLQKAFLGGDGSGFNQAAGTLSAELAKLPAAHRPTAEKIATELRYNRLHPYTLAWKLMAAGAVLGVLSLAVKRRWFDLLVIVAMLAGFGVLTYGMGLRWQIAGRIPAANMFESLLFLSWGAGAFAIVAMLFLKDRSVPLTASAMGALALFLADTLPIDSFIRPIAPVLLDTVWMSIHVPGIMVSYAVLALAALIAHVQMIVMAVAPRSQKLTDKIDAMHYWYMHVGVILLGAGIITGSMWAAFSWGRYWGWDPKEVWSLIAFLAYLVIMHVRVDHERLPGWINGVAGVLGVALLVIVAPKLAPLTTMTALVLLAAAVVAVLFVMVRGQFASAFKSAVAFWFIIMTYVGVNYVLGIGLHSYGFGTGAVVHYMMLTGSIDLLIIGLLTVIYLARTRAQGEALPNMA